MLWSRDASDRERERPFDAGVGVVSPPNARGETMSL